MDKETLERVKANLLAARKLLGEGPHRWTQRAIVRDYKGAPLLIDSPNAYCFCLTGALTFVTEDLCLSLATTNLLYFLPAYLPTSVLGLEHFNDAASTSYEDILALLDAGVAECDRRLQALE